MHTIRLQIDDSVYERLMWLLGKFGKNEVEIIEEDAHFAEAQKYLKSELREITENKAVFVSVEEADLRLEKLLQKHENRL
jgi:hypothetical protein